MYENLTIDHTLSLISEEEVCEFKQVAAKHSYITQIIGNREFDLFMWRIALDVYHLIGKKDVQIFFVPDRAMVSPLQYFLLNKFVSSNEFKRLAYTKGDSKYERFLISINIAVSIKRWTFIVLNGEKDRLKEIFTYGDLFGYIHSAKLEIEDLPLDVLKNQARVMKKLKVYMVDNELFTEKLKGSIKESKQLSNYLTLPIEECVQWKITQLK